MSSVQIQLHTYSLKKCSKTGSHYKERLTISVGQQLHEAIQTRIPDLANVGSTAANGLDCGSHKVFVHAFNVCLPEK